MDASTITTSRTWSLARPHPAKIATPRTDLPTIDRRLVSSIRSEDDQGRYRGGEGGIRTLGGALGHLNRLAGGPIRPLWHLPGSIGQVAWYCTASRVPNPPRRPCVRGA